MSERPGAGATTVASVYVHAPFCARRCVYCDFAVTVRSSGDLAGWIAALKRELVLVEREALFSVAERLDTLYVGGGTPSLLGPDAMAGLAAVLGPERLTGSAVEWTAEANPESFTPDVARGWAEAGVNRISLGAQSFDATALRWMGRLHGADGPAAAVAAARRAGIENVSVDLIFGLPGHLKRSWRDDLDRVIALDVPHVSLYGLTVEPETALGRAVREGREGPVDEERYRDEFLLAAELLTGAGYGHYEVSNFARPGRESRHNTLCWRGRPYLGLGNGAHSFAPPVRRWNVREWEAYRTAVEASVSPEAEREELDRDARDLERTWLGLRTARGIERPPAGSRRAGLVERWETDGLARTTPDRVRLTTEGWLLLDRLSVEYDAVGSG